MRSVIEWLAIVVAVPLVLFLTVLCCIGFILWYPFQRRENDFEP